MKFLLLLTAVFLFFNGSSQCFDNVTIMKIKHVAVKNNHFIPSLLIDFQSGKGNKKASPRILSDTANFVTMVGKNFKILLDYLFQESLTVNSKGDTTSKFGEIRISFYEDERNVFVYSIQGKANSINYLNSMLTYVVSNELGSDLVTVLEYLISDIENHR